MKVILIVVFSGYSCEDHFSEPDTFLHSWEVLLELMMSSHSQNMLIDVGMPIQHFNVACEFSWFRRFPENSRKSGKNSRLFVGKTMYLYIQIFQTLDNCRVIFYNKKIVLIRPKMLMCDDGNYRETRWFTAWTKTRQVEDFYLPRMISAATGQHSVPFGDAVVSTRDTCIGFETCEELWNVKSTHIDLSLSGVEIMVNGSGSYIQLRKAYVTTDLIRNASFKAGGLYMFSNLRGCDGQRVWWSGNSAIALNGDIIARAKQFSLSDVEVTTATVDLEDIRSYRMALRSRCTLGASAPM